MFQPATPAEFYYATLQQHGIHVQPEDVTKVASDRGVNAEIAKLAKVFYDQLTLDGIKYASAGLRLDDAFKLASAYAAHVTECEKRAAKVATDLLRVCKHAAEGYLAQHGLELTAGQALKVAAEMAMEEEEEEDEDEEDDEQKED